MTISVRTHTIVKLHVNYNTASELHQREDLYFAILSKVFLHKPTLIVTIAPQKKYSIGYEIGSFQEMKINKSKFLINIIQSCSSSALREISRSEEFSRGLLLLMTGTKNLVEGIEEGLRYIDNNIGIENLSYETVLCENDGNSFCLYNTAINSEELIDISKKILVDVNYQ